MRRPCQLVALAALAACAPQPDPSVPVSPTRDRVEVTLAAPPRQAFDRVVAAFVAESLAVAQAEAEGGLVVSVPVTPNPGAMFPGEYTYRATILPEGAGSRVVLSALLRTAKQDYPTTAPVTSVCERYPTHECHWAWAKVERLADAVASR